MSSSVLAEGARGGRVTIIGQLGKALVQLVSVVLLSRLLSPDDFGLIAMVTVVVALGDLLRDFGLSTSGLQARKLSDVQASNLFWANTLLGFMAAGLMALITPVLVLIYDEHRLWAIAPVLAVSLLLNGLQSQLQVKLSRDRKYAALAFTDLGSQAIALVIAVMTAIAGWGYWALVAQTLVAAGSLLVSRALIARWIPQRPQRDADSRSLLVSGAYFGGAHFLQFLSSNTDTVMMGAIWGPTILGYYNRAFQLLSQPISRLLAPLMNVVVPTINAAKDRGEDVRGHYLRIQSLIGMVSTFVFVVTAASADSLIPLFLGSQWESSVSLFKILALGGAAQGLSQVSYWIFITEGKSRDLFKYNAVTKMATVVAVAGATFISFHGTAWAYSLSLLISWPVNVLWLQRTADFPARRFLMNGGRILVMGIGAALITLLIPLDSLGWPVLGVLILKILVSGFLFFILLCSTKSGRQDLGSLVQIVRRLV